MTLEDIINFEDPVSVLRFTLVTFFAIFFRYVLICGVFILVFDRILQNSMTTRKINTSLRPPSQKWKEVMWSCLSSFIFAISGTLLLYAYTENKTLLYDQFSLHDIWYIPLSILLVLFLHETYYYFLHRWMHHPKVFRHFHKVHHDSIITSAWTSFSFHPLETLLQALIIPLATLIVPLHIYSLFFLLVLMTVSATINHLNIEIYPGWMARTGIGKWVIGATHHSQHHKYYTKNFGLYFTFYDRILQTESTDFETVFLEKTQSNNE